MSSAGPQRSYGQRGGHSRNQKRFVPKGDTSSPSPSSSRDNPSISTHHPRPQRFTRPLRAPPQATPPAAREKDGRHLTFVNYLPQDEALASGLGVDNSGLDAVESQSVVDILNDELSRLLKLNTREFWREVASNDSLLKFLDSYLLFRNRWYDFPHRGAKGIVAGVIVGEADLSRRVFMALYRMSSNKDPGAHDCLSAKEHTALLQEKKLLDLPKLMDLCAIYGHDNNELTSALVSNAMKAQPRHVENITDTCHYFLRIADTMHQRCSTSLEVLVSSGGQEDHGHNRFRADLLEVMDFINDAIVTMDAFVVAYKPAAMYFSYPAEISHGNQELLGILRRLHDSLLPSLQQGFTLVSSNGVRGENSNDGTPENITLSLKLLSMRIVEFGWKLLEICYLSDEFLENGLLQPATKMFPAKVDDPVIRGEILVQTFREISTEAYNSLVKIQDYETFLQIIEKNYYILSRIDSLRTNGWIFIDAEQFHYIAQIVMPLSSNTWEKEPKVPVSSLSNKVAMDEDAVIMESKISQIKDLFPDYGKGFLSACLDVYNQNPEEVIQRILEGTLHDDLLSLDTSLEQVPPPKMASNRVNGKGKGALLDSGTESRRDKGKGLLLDTPSQDHTLPSVDLPVGKREANVPSSSSFLSSNGRYTRKSRVGPTDSEVLDSKAAKDSVRSAVLAADVYEDEYNDEYDDSFDDLGLSVVESGTEETEKLGDATGSENSNNNSRWSSQKKPQFYVKDGKNYSYKVSGSIAASNSQEAALINLTQKELIHGLGRGGNIPIRAPKKLDSDEPLNEDTNTLDSGGRGNSYSRGRGGRRGGNYHRKDQAMKKHFAGLTGF